MNKPTKKTTRKVASKQPTKKIRQEIRILYDKREKEREKERHEEERRTELVRARKLLVHRYWEDKKATINDVLAQVCWDMHTVKNILEGISISIYETNIEGPDCLNEKQQTAILLGIHHTLELLVNFMGEKIERADIIYTNHLPAREKEGQP